MRASVLCEMLPGLGREENKEPLTEPTTFPGSSAPNATANVGKGLQAALTPSHGSLRKAGG